MAPATLRAVMASGLSYPSTQACEWQGTGCEPADRVNRLMIICLTVENFINGSVFQKHVCMCIYVYICVIAHALFDRT